MVDVPKYLCRDEVLHFFWARYKLADAGTYRLAQSGSGALDWTHRSKVVNPNIKDICSAYFLIEGQGAVKQTIALGDRNVGPDYALSVYGRSRTRDGWLIETRHNREWCLAQR